MIRGSLVSLLHHKALVAQSGTYEDGRAITLMTSDVASVETALEMVHEMWGLVVEVIVGVVLLATQVGWLWPLPFAIIFCEQKSSS
jgi:ATP-binding cassette, subfamily C (CFTR/MRP), member 1